MGARQSTDDDRDWRTSVAPLVVGAVIWESLSWVTGRGPSGSHVVLALVALVHSGVLLPALATSLVSLAIGFAAAAALGVSLGLVTGRSVIADRLVDVYLDAAMAAPTLIYVPVLFALFGVSRASQAAVVFAYAFFIIATTTSAAIRQVDARLIDMARTFGATRRQLLWSVALPAARPLVLTGLSLGMARAVKGMVVGEMVIALSGIGAMLRAAGARFDVAQTLALLLAIVIVSVACSLLVSRLGRAAIDA